ncbi:autotransporter outer membrane beta-barrel domain-containing protein [Pseudomonas sp. MYb118]|uniref:autotransporter outer membrane beta-barrel domain-containing protein n=1 Tax=Pseudomonas sp. MYb118 TaxID=1848720 RepID=UPI0034CD305D
MTHSTLRPARRYPACALTFLLCIGGSQTAAAACTLVPTAGNDSFTCDSASSGSLTDTQGNNTLTFPANGTGSINGNVTFGAGADTVIMNSGFISGFLNVGDGTNTVTIAGGTVTGTVIQGSGVDSFIMNGGTIGALSQGDSHDKFLMTAGTIIGAFEDGDEAKMTGGAIGRVDMKLDDNIFELLGGTILGNLVTGFGRDTIIVAGGRIGGNLSVSGGNDIITVTGGEIVGEVRASIGDDILTWNGGGIIRSAILMDLGNDRVTLRNLTDSILAITPNVDGGAGNDRLTFDQTTSSGAGRYTNWETVNLTNTSRFDLQNDVFRLGDSNIGTGVFNVDGSSTLTSVQGGISPLNAALLATLNNSGTIDLASGNSRTDDSLTVLGNYAGSGGKLLLQSALGDDASPSDKLVVNNGTLTGNTLITVSNEGGAGALTQQNGIQVVQALGSAVSENGAFALQAPVSAGAYSYNLYKGGITPGSENSWYLRSSVVAPPVVAVPDADPSLPPTLEPVVPIPVVAAVAGVVPELPAVQPGAAPIPTFRPEVPVWSAMPPVAAQMTLNALGTFHDRQGKQQLLKGSDSLSAGWGRVYGKNFDQTWAGTVNPKVDGSLYGFQVGTVLHSSQWDSGQIQQTGFFVGHSRLRGDVDGFNGGFEGKHAGKVDLRGDSVGLSWTLTDTQGAYLDTVAMYTRLDGDNESDRGLKIDNDGHVATLSAEVGYPIALGANWQAEPQAQVIYQKVDLDSQDDGISRVSFDSDSAWTGRIGGRLKGRYQVMGKPVEPYVRANVWHTASAEDTVTFAGTDKITTEQRSSSLDLGIGVVLSLSPDIAVYASTDYSSNIDSNQLRGTQANLGVRVSW